MRTVIGLFDEHDEALQAYEELQSAGFAKSDLDILTNDDSSDEPKLARIRQYVPEPDSTIYLEGMRQGGTLITARVGDGFASRVAEIMSGYSMVNVQEHVETIHDTVRRQDVEVEAVAGGVTSAGSVTGLGSDRRDFSTYENDFRTYYTSNWANSGMTYEQYTPSFRYGYDLAYNDAYRNQRWSDIELTARRDWETRYPETAWDKVKSAVQYSWEKVTGQR